MDKETIFDSSDVLCDADFACDTACEILECYCKEFGYTIDRLVPVGREQSLAKTKLEECVMWANAGIARGSEK